LQSGSFASVHSVPLYGSTDSSTIPNWWIARMLSLMFEPSDVGSDFSCTFTAHCRYCSLKLGFIAPAFRYRCSMRPVVVKIVHTPRRF
jgi:hypothetical protein